MTGRVPIVGQWYSVVCPTCFSSVSFECISTATYGIKCSACGTMVNLRDPSVTLPDNDIGRPPANSPEADEAVYYSAEVEECDGLSAAAQVSILINQMEKEKQKTMPTSMTGETTQAFTAKRTQAIADRISFFHPLTHAIERVVFGTKPDAKIGHIRLFRKRIPLFGYVIVPVTKTTTSYAAPSVITLSLYLGFHWFCHVTGQDWLYRQLFYEHFLVAAFYLLMFRLAYADPGFIRPGYVDREDRLNDELTLKDIESNQRESKWETVNGVPMERKWCSTCEMYRPVRAAHCYLCGMCCYDHDHHCNVIGVCVGRRRVEMFTLFVSITSMALINPTACIAVFWFCQSDLLSSGQFYGMVVLFLFLLVFTVTISMTAVSMLQSLALEATTRERLQNVYLNKRNPFNRGILKNLQYHLLERKLAPTLFDEEFVKTCQLRYEKRELGTGTNVTCT